ncbi:unnamed protein product [Chrysoparadoxa australica]
MPYVIGLDPAFKHAESLSLKLKEAGLLVAEADEWVENALIIHAPPDLIKKQMKQQTYSVPEGTGDVSESEECRVIKGLIDGVDLDMPSCGYMLQGQPKAQQASSVHSLVHALQVTGAIRCIFPAHSSVGLRACSSDPDSIMAYFGSGIAFYFAWMQHFTVWLRLPAVAGLALYARRVLAGDSVDDDPYVPFYSLTVILWGAAFQIGWRRTSALTAWRWGTLLDDGIDDVRPEFQGELRISPVTGKLERHFPRAQRLPRYFVSALFSSFFLALAVGAMVCSLNLQGYVEHDNKLEGLIYLPTLARMADADGIFDANGYWLGYLPKSLGPTILHVLVINNLNAAYRAMAEKLTDWENHRTAAQYRNALVVKRFAFEAFDCYISLFYIAFFQLDIVRLRAELVGLYMVDSIRRLATESLLPLAMQVGADIISIAKGDLHVSSHGTSSRQHLAHPAVTLAEQVIQDEYESFDDFLEMAIEFGYVTLFASAFPLAGLVSLLANAVEVRSDLFRLKYVFRRPNPERHISIGVWATVMDCMVYLSILTNCLLFALSSEQMLQWMPWLFGRDMRDGEQILLKGMGRWVVGIAFGMEHLLLLLVVLMGLVVPSWPEEVRVGIKRFHWLREHKQKSS